jgi:hypothetical protein
VSADMKILEEYEIELTKALDKVVNSLAEIIDNDVLKILMEMEDVKPDIEPIDIDTKGL